MISPVFWVKKGTKQKEGAANFISNDSPSLTVSLRECRGKYLKKFGKVIFSTRAQNPSSRQEMDLHVSDEHPAVGEKRTTSTFSFAKQSSPANFFPVEIILQFGSKFANSLGMTEHIL